MDDHISIGSHVQCGNHPHVYSQQARPDASLSPSHSCRRRACSPRWFYCERCCWQDPTSGFQGLAPCRGSAMGNRNWL